MKTFLALILQADRRKVRQGRKMVLELNSQRTSIESADQSSHRRRRSQPAQRSRRHGFRVGHDRRGRPATARTPSCKLADFPADVIVTDLNMPGLDGFGLLQKLRDSGDMPPTIVLTAYGNIETAVKTVHELGAYWFLEKPIQPGVWRFYCAAPAATPDCAPKIAISSGNSFTRAHWEKW